MRVVDEAVEQQAAPGSPAQVSPVSRPAGRRRLTDLAAFASFLMLAMVVLCQLWLSPNGRVLSGNDDDHGVFMFLLSHGERVVFHGADPFHSDRINVPDGVNMMANTSILALSLPVAPITHYLGVGVSVALLLTLGLFGTAVAWYVVLARHLVRSRAAAYVGALWCGFAPTMVSHANGHINFVSQFVVPFIVWQVLRLREPGRVWRSGVSLALLIVLQVFINEEILLFTALTLAFFVLAYAVLAPRAARAVAGRMAAGLGVAAGLSGTLLAYPLWLQFFGPGSYHGQPFAPDKYVTDLLSLGAFARQSLAGNGVVARALSVSATEDNTFFGLPVLVMLVVSMVILRRCAAAKAAAFAAAALLVASFGPQLRVASQDTGIPLPFGLISHIPIIDLVSVTRFSMATATVVGLLLALAADRMTLVGSVAAAGDTSPRDVGAPAAAPAGAAVPTTDAAGSAAPGAAAAPRGGAAPGAEPVGPAPGAVPLPRRRLYPHRTRVAFWAALIAALVPVAPKPLPIVVAAPLPAFITQDLWRPYVPAGRSLVPVPLPDVTTGREGMRWAALSGLEFAVPRGYFMGPANPPVDTTGSWNAPRRATSDLLARVLADGHRPLITAADRQAATADLIFWRAAAVALIPNRHSAALQATLTDLLGRSPQQVGGVMVWDVRDLPVPPPR